MAFDRRGPKPSSHTKAVLATFAPMKLRPALIELVVADMAATLAFYRRLGLDIPAGAEVDEAWQDLTAAGYRGHLQP